jgi:hypothetical protein
MKTRRFSGDDTPITGAADVPCRPGNPALDDIPEDADPLTVHLLTLIRLNPGIVQFRTDADTLVRMTPDDKRLLLADIQKALGMKPVGRVIKP